MISDITKAVCEGREYAEIVFWPDRLHTFHNPESPYDIDDLKNKYWTIGFNAEIKRLQDEYDNAQEIPVIDALSELIEGIPVDRKVDELVRQAQSSLRAVGALK